jgi:putative peptide zinc metalloprotease protein
MNLVEALNAALPELPAQQKRKGFPRLNPQLIHREHIEEGEPVVIAHVPGTTDVFRLSPMHWQVLQAFDGRRSWDEVAQVVSAETGVPWQAEEIRTLIAPVEDTELFFRTGSEKSVALQQKLAHERQHHVKKKSKFGDVSHIQFSAWDPDKFFDRVLPYTEWAYSRWFTLLTLGSFVFMIYVFVSRWSDIGSDTLKYYTFTDKSFSDLAEFWLLFFFLAFFHESAHGLTCKHYGGGVRRMGFHLIYLTPAFFVDVTEILIYGGKRERLATIFAGIWMEMMFCAGATVVYWGTPAGSFAHEFAYKVMLITGVAVVVVNMNPLIKLDGYYFFSELLGIPELKEKSTQYLSSWTRRHVFRLPAEVPWVGPRRRWLYVPYAIVSGLYSYMLLFLVVRIARNVFAHWTPSWAFLPALLLAYFIFRSRLRTFGRFMKTMYLDKRATVREFFRGPRLAAAAAAALVLLLAPIWPDRVSGRFLLEPLNRAVLRASVPGTVMEVDADEGQAVAEGATVAKLRNLQLASDAARAEADYRTAAAHANQAQLQYADFAAADSRRRALQRQAALKTDEASKLILTSPIAGTVVTPRVHNLLNSYLPEGALVAEVADLSVMRARVYLPDFEVRDVRAGSPATMHFDSFLGGARGRVKSLSPASEPIAPGLLPKEAYAGMLPPPYYAVQIELPNPAGRYRIGMTGTAKIRVGHRSLLGFLWRDVHDFAGRKIW